MKNYNELLGEVKFVHAVNGPVLFIKGSESDYIDENKLTSYKKYLPNFKISVIEGASHWVHVDRPDDLLLKINDFLLSQIVND